MLNIIWVKLIDYKNTLPMIAVMTIMALVLIFIFGRGFDGSYTPSVGIVDNDQSETSANYIEQVMTSEGYDFTIVTLDEGKEGLKKGDYMALVQVTQGFEKGLLKGESDVIMFKSGDSIEHQMLAASLGNISRLYVMNEGFVNGLATAYSTMGIGIDKAALHNTIAYNRETYPVMTVEVKSLNAEEIGGYDAIKHSFMGYILFFSMFTMVFGVGSIVEERENKVWQRQVVSPLSRLTVLAGNMVTSFIVGMVQLSFMVLFSKVVFGIDYGGSIFALLVVLSFYVIAITCLGLLLSNLVKTSQQLGSFSPVVIVGTSMIGGCMWPLSIISSKVLLFLADLTPQRWAYQGLNTIIVNNGNLADVKMPLLYLLIIALVLFGLAMLPREKCL